MKKVQKLAAVAISSLLVFGLSNVAAFASTLPATGSSARPPLPKPVPPPHVHGTIETINGNLLTIQDKLQTVNVQLSASTLYDRGPAQQLNLSNLKVGLKVNVEGLWDNGTFDAVRVHLDPPPGLPHPPGEKPDGLGGIIQSVNGQSLMIKTPDGRTITVTINGNTKFHSGPLAIGSSALQAGKEVHIRLVTGEQVSLPSSSSNQTIPNLTAADVDVVPPHWDGTITGGQDNSFTLETRDGQKMTISLSTGAVINFGPHSTASQLSVGMKVHVEGTANGSDIVPTKIDVHP